MNKFMPNTTLKPIALLPLLVRVRTAPTVENQMDLLLGAGEFRSFSIYPISEREKLSICEHCGSVTTPFGPYGDIIELEFAVHGFKLIYRTKETWAGGRSNLRQLLKDPAVYLPNLNRTVARLKLKGFPKPSRSVLSKIGNVVAMASIGFVSWPSVPLAAAPHPVEPAKDVSKVDSGSPNSPAEDPFWIPVNVTSYCWQERDHVPYGKHNCMGGDLTHLVEGLTQCAADLKYYPLGSILCIRTEEGEEFRIVTDCGRFVRGAHHIDLHFDTLLEMEAKGSRKALITVIRHGWKA